MPASIVVDQIVDALSQHGLLPELAALAWFCDASLDGKYPLIPTARRRDFEPGGDLHPLVSLGCVEYLGRTWIAALTARRPAIRMAQTGRRVLLRAAARAIPLEPTGEPATEPAS